MKKTNTLNNFSIQLSDVSKTYFIHHEKPTLVEKFINNKNEKYYALQHITLKINKGEKIGILGPNGSGKTTLLKIISGITSPSSGTVLTKGKIVSLIDLDAGFHPDLPGYQNIYLNSLLLGMKKKEVDQNLRKIIHFADIKQFIDTPMYMYSEGMKLRLGFSIAIHSKAEIFVLDEGISVGDLQFQFKTEKTINTLSKQNKTIIVVSHYKKVLMTHATRFIQLKNGSIIKDGDISVLNNFFDKEY